MASSKRSTKSRLEERFAQVWVEMCPDLPAPQRDYRFAARYVGLGPGVRARLKEAGLQDWKIDFAWVVFRQADGRVHDSMSFHEAGPHNVKVTGGRIARVALEVEGATWGKVVVCPHCGRSTGKREAGGRHVRGSGFKGDVRKYNTMTRLGWRLFRATGDDLKEGRVEELVAMLREEIEG